MTTIEKNSPETRGRMIAVCSAKGGIGRTILSVNLAVSLAKRNNSVAILDGDFQFGDVSLAMDLQHTFTIKEAMEGITSLDEDRLEEYMSSHNSGVRVLPAPDRPEFADLLTKEAVSKMVNLLLLKNDFVVCDTGAGLNEHTLNLIEKADEILVVATLEMAAMKNTKLLLETLGILGLRDKVRVVLNRANMESVIKAEDGAKILGEEAPVFIPNDFQICSRSLNMGTPFVISHSKSEISKSVFKMAEMIGSNVSSTKAIRKKGKSFSLFPWKRRKGGVSK
ncbi:MinD/ParA family protein [Neobacillus notoginsengisoli]|uniref:MinD/ParA family protein n=1 Tax=Neobacillus notoginsengisoli TaxID=1578198 RepID=A0A417YZJ7_9BACI|nr:AAA family ATPase [Neobacillus notoginsengisoli]RHW43174.1 MinD/ParA family protein [Neobacillus notoginsengisoli]